MTVATSSRMMQEVDGVVVEHLPPAVGEVDDGNKKNNDHQHIIRGADESPASAIVSVLPEWVLAHQAKGTLGELLEVDEWKQEKEEGLDDEGGDSSYRKKNGWQGRDLIHDVHSPVRILEYFVKYGTSQPLTTSGLSPRARGGAGTTLTGTVHFTKRAESHQGYCHGGSMTSVLDDVIGWVAFLVTGECRPWTGYTVQVNTSLKRPIPVDSVLIVQATIVQIVRRKVSVHATIFDPQSMNLEGTGSMMMDDANDKNDSAGDDDVFQRMIRANPDAIHATAEGLVVMNRGVLPPDFDRSSTLSTASSSMSETS